MLREEFKSKIKSVFAIIGVLSICSIIVGQFISIILFCGFLYIYFLQKNVYIALKEKYNLLIDKLYESFGNKIDIEKYRK